MIKVSTLTVATVAALFFGVATNAGEAIAQERTLRQQIVGTWKLVSNDNIAPNGEKRQLFGPSPRGLAIYDASGWYTVIQLNPDRPKFKGKTRLDGTSEENKAVVAATAFNFGTWSVNEADKTLTVRQEANLFPNDDGLESKRAITLTGDELKVSNPNPSSGGASVIVWKRVK